MSVCVYSTAHKVRRTYLTIGRRVGELDLIRCLVVRHVQVNVRFQGNSFEGLSRYYIFRLHIRFSGSSLDLFVSVLSLVLVGVLPWGVYIRGKRSFPKLYPVSSLMTDI